MFGAIVGDVVGSVYEFDNIKSKDFPWLSEESTFTDDTVCTLAVAESILDDSDISTSLRKWCRKYWRMSYGHSFMRWLRLEEPVPYESWGNGAAMRVSTAAFLAPSIEHARILATKVTEVTHNHPEGLKGALATTDAIFLAFSSWEPDEIRRHITETYGYDLSRTVDEIRPTYRFNESCQETVPEAIICALDATGFEDAIRNAISIGGDSDTLAAITGAIAEARFGAEMPLELCYSVVERLPEDLCAVLKRIYDERERHTGCWRPAWHL